MISTRPWTGSSLPGAVRSVLMQWGSSPWSMMRRPWSKPKFWRPWAVSSHTPRSAASFASGTSLPLASRTPPGRVVKKWVMMSPSSMMGRSCRMTLGS